MNILKKIYRKILSARTRENILLFTKSAKTRQHLFRKLKIEQFTKNNCYHISNQYLPESYQQNTCKTAVHFHIFYTDLLEEIYSHLCNINTNYDLYISTNGEEHIQGIKLFFNHQKINAQNIFYENIENRGRDVWPFLKMIGPVYNNYDFVAHLHTKKSVTQGEKGNKWRKYLYNNLLGNGYYFDNLIALLLRHKEIGMIAPPPFPDESLYYAYFMRNSSECKNNLNNLFIKMGCGLSYGNPLKYQFPAGNMFIARTEAIKQLIAFNFQNDDFPKEMGQQGNTLQHTIEHSWHYFVAHNGYQYKECFNINSQS